MAGIYVHIPLCKTKCNYCDFFSVTKLEHKNALVQAIVHELQLQQTYLQNEPVNTIYFGGGTPSLLNADEFQLIFDSIQRNYDTANLQEVTLEANPDDINEQYLESIRYLPFNRISIGIQSFCNQDLRLLNRRHDSQQATRAVQLCQAFGYKNVSVDLIYGLPNQTIQRWNRNLDSFFLLGVQHLSAYHLSYETGTALHQQMLNGKVQPVDEYTSEQLFYTLLARCIQEKFNHYEISNFALAGMESLHNSGYWADNKYLGVGPAAHSYNGNSRQWNVKDVYLYIQCIQNDRLCFKKEFLGLYTLYNEFLITKLRTINGFSLSELKNRFGNQLFDYFLKNAQPYLKQQLLVNQQDTIRLATNALFISDGIVAHLMHL
jgi:oxygen-independent coproporphyrinogen-3 oxidase